MTKKKYTIHPPLWYKGDRVWFLLHNGAKRWGYITSVETHYDHKHVAYHIYGVLPAERTRRVYVGEQKIISHTN